MQYEDIQDCMVSIANTRTVALHGIACYSVVVSGSLVLTFPGTFSRHAVEHLLEHNMPSYILTR